MSTVTAMSESNDNSHELFSAEELAEAWEGMPQFVTADQLADMLATTRSTIYRAVKRGHLHSIKVETEHRFSRKGVLAWLSRQERAKKTERICRRAPVVPLRRRSLHP